MKVFRPWAFQGSLSRKNYFEGWYFKHVSSDLEDVWSFIPGISLSPEGRQSFIQVLNGRTGASQVFNYGVEAFTASKKELNGGLHTDNAYVDFDGGTGYIEKDWGTSFPESWIWLHCNTFNASISSFTFSVAKIPWLGSYFIGFISYLKLEGRFFNFSTWSKAKIKKLEHVKDKLIIQIENKDYLLDIEAINQEAGLLKAPKLGSMTRIIKETVDATIWIRLREHSGIILFEDRGTRAGMELIDKILSYL